MPALLSKIPGSMATFRSTGWDRRPVMTRRVPSDP